MYPHHTRDLLSYCQQPTEPSMHLVNTEGLVNSSVSPEHEAIWAYTRAMLMLGVLVRTFEWIPPDPRAYAPLGMWYDSVWGLW